MTLPRDEPARTLHRLLANGPVTGWPKKPEDSALLVRLAAVRFEPGRDYREAEVNDVLREWLATFSAEYGIDHVTMRRELVDWRWVERDKLGTSYRLDAARVPELEPMRAIDLAAIIVSVREERERRKRENAARG